MNITLEIEDKYDFLQAKKLIDWIEKNQASDNVAIIKIDGSFEVIKDV